MKATVDREGCIECGLCASVCPEVFRMGDDGPAEAYVDEVPESAEQTAVEAQEGCPVSVITVEYSGRAPPSEGNDPIRRGRFLY